MEKIEWKDYVKYDPTSKSFLRKIKGRGVGSEEDAKPCECVF